MSENKKLNTNIYSKEGEKTGTTALPSEIFGLKVNSAIISQAVRVYLMNQRRGTASAKKRGEVSGGGRKPWRQKGTGRARHGSIRSPIWVKGGVAHGPLPKDWSLKMSKKMKKKALLSSLSAKFQNQSIKVIESLSFDKVKTKKAKELLKKLELSRSVLVVVPQKNDNVYLSFKNIPRVDTVIAKQINTYEVVSHDVILLVKDSIKEIKKTFIENNNVKEKANKAN